MFLNLNSEQLHALDAAKQAFGPMLEGLVKYSIPITLVTFVLGLIIALFTALMRISTSKVLRSIARVYVSIIRGTPMIVQLFIIFYGIPELGRLLTNDADNQWTLAPVVAAGIISINGSCIFYWYDISSNDTTHHLTAGNSSIDSCTR